MKKLSIFFFLFVSFFPPAFSQQLKKEDYQRAAKFLLPNLLNKRVYNYHVEPTWFKDSSGFSYVTQSAAGKVFSKILFGRNEAESLLDHERLSKSLSDLWEKEVRATDLPITNIQYVNAANLEFTAENRRYQLDLGNYAIRIKEREQQNSLEQKSPDGKWIAYAENYNLFIRSTETGEIKQLSTTGQKNYEYAAPYGWSDIIQGENGDRPKRFQVRWSPDSRWIQTYIVDLRSGNKMYLLDWSRDTLYRPVLLSYYRASPGDTDMVYTTPVFFNIETGEEIRRDAARNTHTFPTHYEWSKKEGIIYELKRWRGFQRSDISRINLRDKKDELLYSETSKTNIDNFDAQLAEESGKMILLSEKDGWRQIYLLNLDDRTVKPVTNGAYYVNEIMHIDKKTGVIIFTASGREAGRNPYLHHAYRINLNGKGLALLTLENLHHDISVSPDGKYFVDNMSALDRPTKTVLRSTATGRILKEVSNAVVDNLLALNYKYPELFTATARDGITTIYGAIWKPTSFDASKKYPVIDQSYTGPHTNMFPKSFFSSIARDNQALSELGFIVVTIDGMGTAGRSKAFHDVSYKNMGKNLTDHVLAIKELGRKYTWVDTTRVGIFGHSAGGYDAAHALLEFPDFYKVAVASSADHDFRMEKDWWPEMYMGWPVDSTYHAVSNITMAGNLKGKLLITHGGIDENVNPSATFKLAEALIKANKQFDMLIFPSQRHGYTGKYNEYFLKRRWNYFVEHLLDVKPVWDFEF